MKAPWMVEPINGGETYQITSTDDAGFTVIAETPWGLEAGAAIATLIAAAPDLLDACCAARRQLATAVIANSGGLFDHDSVGEHEGVAKLDAAIARALTPSNGEAA